MKYQRITTINLNTVAVNQSDRVQKFQADALKITAVVGGTVHAFANFDAHVLNISLRSAEGKVIQVMGNVRFSDLLKASDYAGGFSAKTKANANGRYVAYIPLGNIIISGDDILEVNSVFAGHATATYAYTIDALDLVQGYERIKTYESKAGTGATEYLKNVEAVYTCSVADGSIFLMKDEENGAFSVEDNVAVDVANALGKFEAFEDFGVVFSDRTGLSQALEITIPNGKRILVVKRAFPIERLGNIQEQVIDRRKLIEKMSVTDPDKVRYLAAVGDL